MHYYKKNIGDYHKKAGRLSMLEHGAYTLLIDACYDRERFPTMEEAIEWSWARSQQEEEAVRFVLSRFFECRDGVYVQTRIEEEIANYRANAETNSRIAKEREEKRKERARSVDGSSANVHEPPPNQEPRTKNQEPQPKEEESEKPNRSPRGSRLPDGFPGDEEVAWQRSERPDLESAQLTAKFRDYWAGVPGAKGRKADWPATWRNFVRGEWQRPQARASPPSTRAQDNASFVAHLTGRFQQQGVIDGDFRELDAEGGPPVREVHPHVRTAEGLLGLE